jgi:hypothetical protein
MVSLRQSLNQIGEPAHFPFPLRASFGGRLPHGLRMALDGMTDPEVDSWTEIGRALSIENTEDSDQGQGIATDGNRWFISSNGSKRVVIYDDAQHFVSVLRPTTAVETAIRTDAGNDAHFGALGFHAGALFVPIQNPSHPATGPHGVWRIDLTNGLQTWVRASALPDGSLFPWCAVHPVTGILYTCSSDNPPALRAYDRDTLVYRPQDDVTLLSTPIELDNVQGGTFTDRGRLLLVRSPLPDPVLRSGFNGVFCFSSLNGHCFGAKPTGDFNSDFSELEAVAVRDWQFNGTASPVHLFELDNDHLNLPFQGDDVYLHSFSIPHPSQL